MTVCCSRISTVADQYRIYGKKRDVNGNVFIYTPGGRGSLETVEGYDGMSRELELQRFGGAWFAGQKLDLFVRAVEWIHRRHFRYCSV